MMTVKMAGRKQESVVRFYDGVEQTFAAIKEQFEGDSVMLFTDETVFGLYEKQILKYFGETSKFVMCAGEANKNEKTLFALLQKMSDEKLLRNSVLICLGGGVVGDLGGLAASLYMRGIRYVHMPTSLLAQTDSCLGGKTAVDFCGVKNLLGAFYAPTDIYVTTDFFKTLPLRELRCGLGEIVKHGALCADLFELLVKNQDRLTELDFLKEILPMSLAWKASVVEQDPYEKNLRKSLNLGHTTAHAIELHSALSHGECVLMGILLESYFARGDEEFLAKLRKLCLAALGKVPKIPIDALKAALMDKKNVSEGTVSLTLATALGKYEFLELPYGEYVAGIQKAEVLCSNLR